MAETPKVFISYSWDSEEHKAWVKHLADRLIADGVSVILDQYDAGPGADFIHFMEQAVAQSDRVISVLTDKYKTRADERNRGVGYESVLTSWQFYDKGIEERFMLPIVRSGDFDKVVPNYLRSIVALDFRNDDDFEAHYMSLLKAIYNHSDKPQLGSRPDFTNSSPTLSNPPSGASTPVVSKKILSPLQEIKKLLALNKLDEAIEKLLELANDSLYEGYENSIIMQSARWNGLKRKIDQGLLSNEQEVLQTNRISNALLSLHKDMEKEA
ncbi:MAG: TIR domain-containing protein [Bacteroidota bacterium]